MSIVKRTIETRIKDGAPKVKTEVSIDFNDPAAEREFAIRGAIIRAQSIMRASGAIPPKFDTTISELAAKRTVRVARAPTAEEATAAIAAAPNDVYRAQLIALGVDAKTADRMVKARAARAAK